MGVFEHLSDKRWIDLDLVQRELTEVAEARIACTEIVENDLDPEIADSVDAAMSEYRRRVGLTSLCYRDALKPCKPDK